MSASYPRWGECRLEEVTRPATIILNMDLETLARSFSEQERLGFYNELVSAYKRFLIECMPRLDQQTARLVQGRFELAKLLLAASFRLNGEDYPEITGQFSDEEYELLFDLEELKILDYLSVDEIVEMIKRREGRVYEVAKRYYARQYKLLDREWNRLKGPLALAMEERYRERRHKIEEAVNRYTRERGLLAVVDEIEEAAKSIANALNIASAAKRKAAKLLAIAARLDLDSSAPRGEAEKLVEDLEDEARRLESYSERIKHAISSPQTPKPLKRMFEAQLRVIERTLGSIRSLLDKAKGLLASREQVEAGISEAVEEPGGEGRRISREEAWALEEALVQRLLSRIGSEARVFDPRRGRWRSVKWSERLIYSIGSEASMYSGGLESGPSGKGLRLEAKRGLLSKRTDVVVEAVSLLHLDAYRSRGYDSRPVGLEELMGFLEPRLRDAVEGDEYHLILVSSPTGFTGEAIRYVEGGGRYLSLASRNATVYLLDPVEGRLYYDRHSEAARANRSLIEPWRRSEDLEAVRRYVLSGEAYDRAVRNNAVAPYLSLEEIVEATGVDPGAVRAALEMLSSEGRGRVDVVDGRTLWIYSRG